MKNGLVFTIDIQVRLAMHISSLTSIKGRGNRFCKWHIAPQKLLCLLVCRLVMQHNSSGIAIGSPDMYISLQNRKYVI